MAELKTKATTQSVTSFLKTIEPEEKRKDGFELLAMFKKVTGLPPVMWGTAIIGFDKYHYKSERSSQEGDWPLTAFSPRKQNLTLYVLAGFEDTKGLLQKLGKHKTSKGCLYINKLADVDMNVLEQLVAESYKQMKLLHKAV